MKIKNLISMVVILIFVIGVIKHFFFFNPPVNFRNAKLNSKIDSVIIKKNDRPRMHFIQVGEKWYELSTGHYSDFFYYVEKGDSLYKEKGRWDIYVYKKKKGKYIEKYFDGAQGSRD